MTVETAGERVSVARLILVPAIISVVVTLLRLAGELQHWSPRWFSPATGGVVPSGVSWIVGITWLPLFFGVYFALRLKRAGLAPASTARPVVCAFAGVLVVLAFLFLFVPWSRSLGFPRILLVIWLGSFVTASLQFYGWRALAKVLLVYGLASRAVVAVVMFLAMRGSWGTHYDYVEQAAELARMPFWSKYLWLALFPQLVFWIGITILLGSLSGSITHALASRRADAPQPAPSVS